MIFVLVSARSYDISPLLEQGKKGIAGTTGEVGNTLVSAPPNRLAALKSTIARIRTWDTTSPLVTDRVYDADNSRNRFLSEWLSLLDSRLSPIRATSRHNLVDQCYDGTVYLILKESIAEEKRNEILSSISI